MSTVIFDLTMMSDADSPDYVIIDAKLNEDTSCGFISTESVDDIFTLRDSINNFISQHQLSRLNPMTDTIDNRNTDNDSEDILKPRFTDVLDGYLSTEWRPTREFIPGDRRYRILTSQEIMLDLADMVDMELNDVASSMMYLGYRTIISDGKVGWLLERRAR